MHPRGRRPPLTTADQERKLMTWSSLIAPGRRPAQCRRCRQSGWAARRLNPIARTGRPREPPAAGRAHRPAEWSGKHLVANLTPRVVVSEHLDERRHFRIAEPGDRKPRQRRAPRAKGQLQQVVPLVDMASLMGDDGHQLRPGRDDRSRDSTVTKRAMAWYRRRRALRRSRGCEHGSDAGPSAGRAGRDGGGAAG